MFKKQIGQKRRDSLSPFLQLTDQHPQVQKSPNSIPLKLIQNEDQNQGTKF